ncbi:TauD/TfdA family dioxygenase [Streptomyces sp. NPDC059517]|uniref:TauD/TfdA family dioxygenase n=1 Tax=Streptomyces sp. NPDC059517 TaxID=3346855 RepID=UPI0036C0F703
MFTHEVRLSAHSRQALHVLVDEIDSAPPSEETLYASMPTLITRLPAELAEKIVAFRESRTHDALLVRGLPLGAMASMPTPPDAYTASRAAQGFSAVGIAVLGILGTPFAYRGQQNGRLVNNISPMSTTANMSDVGTGSHRPFDLHSEDAFMLNPPSFLQLSCVRNPLRVPTTISGLCSGDLDSETLGELRKPAYLVRTNPGQTGWDEKRLRPGPVVWGHHDRPLLRYNSARTEPTMPTAGAAAALDVLRKVLTRNAEDACLAPGDLLAINNYRLCHARRSFPARFNGSDRWLLRTVAYRDPYAIEDGAHYGGYPVLS